MCSDQEAVDLIRNTQDPQAASRALVDHALARFSTDNLSCMVARFDSKLLQQGVADQTAAIGVDGDAISKAGGISESEAIVRHSQQALKDGGVGATLERVPTQMIVEQQEEHERTDPGPELNAEALRAARKNNKA